MHGQYLFMGNGLGQIRVFNLTAVDEASKPLRQFWDQQLVRNKVTCLSFTPQGCTPQYLIAGYQSGAIALWDLETSKMDKYITEIHESAVVSARCYSFDNEHTFMKLLSTEAIGPVYNTEVKCKKQYIVGDTVIRNTVYNKRLKNPTSIELYRPKEQEDSCWAKQSLAALGAVSEVVIICMNPIREICKIKRPQHCKPNSVPYLCFGRGLTPNNQAEVGPLLVIAWDCLIQVVYFDEWTEQAIMDGLYLADSEIKSVFFTSDSVLTILDEVTPKQTSLKLLYTRKFQFGDYTQLDNSDDKKWQKITEFTKHSELDCGSEAYELKCLTKQNVIHLKNNLKTANYNTVVCKFGRLMLFLHKNQLTRVMVYTHDEFIVNLVQQKQTSWLSVLRSCLELYNGDLSGFADLSDDKKLRQAKVRPRVIAQLMDTLKATLKPQTSFQLCEDRPAEQAALELTLAKATIEYCLCLEATDLLFNEIYNLMVSINRESQFIGVLERYVVSGQLKGYQVPKVIIKKLVDVGQFKYFEQLIMNLNLTGYEEHILDLEQRCYKHSMQAALFYVLVSQLQMQTRDYSCSSMLDTMYKLKQQTQLKESASKETQRSIKREELQLLIKTDSTKRLLIEKSHMYIGYKLLWTIQLLLEGKGFSSGGLNEAQWRNYTTDIINFFKDTDTFTELLLFDAQATFKVTALLFKGRPWEFLQQNKVDPTTMVTKLHEISKHVKQNLKGQKILISYYAFVLSVQVQQQKEKQKTGHVVIELDYQLVFKAIKNSIKPWKKDQIEALNKSQKNSCRVDQDIIISAIRSRQFKSPHIDKMLSILVKKHEVSKTLNIQIELHENRGDYIKAFQCLLQKKSQHFEIFDWIKDRLKLLQRSSENKQMFELLKQTVKQHLRHLAQLELEQSKENQQNKNKLAHKSSAVKTGNIVADTQDSDLFCKMTVWTLHKYFKEDVKFLFSFCEQVLGSYPEVQLHFLKSYIVIKHDPIDSTIQEAIYQPEKQELASQYERLLVLFTLSLCDQEPSNVEKWVNLECFPTRQCMDVCKERKNYLGWALLMERLGDGKEAVRIYMSYLNQIDLQGIIRQLLAMSKKTGEVGKLSHFDILGKFDATLEKATKVASKKDPHDNTRQLYDEEVWLEILEFLHKFMLKTLEKLESQKTQSSDTEEKSQRFKDFCQERIRYVLSRDGMHVSFRKITSRLDLEIGDIKALCKIKLDVIKSNNQRTINLSHIMETDLLNLFQDATHYVAYGAVMRTRFNTEKLVYQSMQVCTLCNTFILNSKDLLPCEAFICGHVYHQMCLRDRKTCYGCAQQKVLNITEDEFGQGRPVPEDANTIANTNREISLQQRSRQVMRQLESLDTAFSDQSLCMDEFL